MNHAPFRKQNAAFTLIELLVVIGIIALLAAVSVPAFNRMVKAAALSNAGFSVTDQLNLARQTALSRNCSVQVRFYCLPVSGNPSNSAPSDYRALQIFLDNGKTLEPLGKPVYFPSQIIIAPNTLASSIMSTDISMPETTPGNGDFPVGEYGTNYRYRSFYFKSGGDTDLPDSQDKLVFLTLINKTDKIVDNGMPSNYITIQIEASTGRVKSYRP
ncbi:MAG: Verru_Chthon cassette protein D [Verrucomicrobiales bacterium]|jgi:uncharacterized protein (TIGR02596 family)|nr:Verru_Chthon cassette protein D [Verrucomicrobiales bacterium]